MSENVGMKPGNIVLSTVSFFVDPLVVFEHLVTVARSRPTFGFKSNQCRSKLIYSCCLHGLAAEVIWISAIREWL